MKSMALRGTIILLAAVALIGAVVALRVAQAQSDDPEYTISVTPNKVLEQTGGSVSITVKVTADQTFTADKTVHLYIANITDSTGCKYFSSSAQCRNSASRGEQQDFTENLDTSVTISANQNMATAYNSNVTPKQDFKIEGDEKIYLVACGTVNCVEDVSGTPKSTLLASTFITIVGEETWADNTKNGNTSTVALKRKPDATPPEDQPVAASFTTGSDTDGYRMNNVKLKFGKEAAPTSVSVELFRDDVVRPGAPGAFISELTKLEGAPEPAAGAETIYTKTGGILLDPKSTYWIRVSGTAGSLETTGNKGQTGWAIQDGFLMDTDTTTTRHPMDSQYNAVAEDAGQRDSEGGYSS